VYGWGRHLVRGRYWGAQVRVLTCSALTGEGVDDIWAAIRQRLEALDSSGALVQRRHAQNLRWLSDLVNEDLRRMLENSAAARGAFEQARAGVLAGSVSPAQAAERIVDALRSELGRPTPVTGTEIAPKEACS
jgi:LAO/AO transport system kinase